MKKFFSDLRRWSKQRPTLGGVLLIISAIFLGLPSLNRFRVGDLILTVSTVSGVSTIVLSALMALCAVSALFWPHARILAGVAAMIIALVAFPAANFGGFIVGTLLGIVGAALVLAWQPRARAEEAAAHAQQKADAKAAAKAGVPVAAAANDAPASDAPANDVPPGDDQPTEVIATEPDSDTTWTAPVVGDDQPTEVISTEAVSPADVEQTEVITREDIQSSDDRSV